MLAPVRKDLAGRSQWVQWAHSYSPPPVPGLPFLPAAQSLYQGTCGQSGYGWASRMLQSTQEWVYGTHEYNGWTNTGECPGGWRGLRDIFLCKPHLESSLCEGSGQRGLSPSVPLCGGWCLTRADGDVWQ